MPKSITVEQRAKAQFKGKDDEYVKDIFKSTYDCVKVAGCFSSRDAILLAMSETELTRRGYEIKGKRKILIDKKGE